ncbi:MAG: hypothetical protein ACTSXD_06885 [Candidatus Heimdallarchaeaceae archaeon]
MQNKVIRVNKKELKDKIDDLKIEGYKLKTQNNKITKMEQIEIGSPLIHMILILLFGFQSFCLLNIVYAIYSYLWETKIITIKIKK